MQLVNEEGLPIIDITEPITTVSERGTSDSLLPEKDNLTPLSSYPSSVREQWRQERDRILDLLEEEESREQAPKEQLSEEQRQEILRKRREAAAQEKVRLQAAKDMQKKLGKALLRGMAETKGKEEAVSPEKPLDHGKNKSTMKTVTFADLPDEDGDTTATNPSSLTPKEVKEWGDVTPARLRSTPGPSLMALHKSPMKLAVVERHPAGQVTPPSLTVANQPDSDDESELGSPDAEHQEGSRHSPVDPDSDTDEVDDVDLDFAQHQREIILQYHEKRARMSEAAAAVMMSHSQNEGNSTAVCQIVCIGRCRTPNYYAFQDIPLDVPSSEQSKPSISRFKASRIAASYGASTPSSSTSLGASVLPVSSARTLQRAIRAGKLDADERLVGGEADSASDEETGEMQEVFELLKKGEVYNLGPDGHYIHAPPLAFSDGKPSNAPATSLATGNTSQSNTFPPLDRTKTSKFKLSRSRPEKSTSAISPSPSLGSQDHTPISYDERSSPKLPAAMTPTVIERQPLQTNATVKSTPSSMATRSVATNSSVSLQAPPAPSNVTSSASPQAFSMVIESPSFPKPKLQGPTPSTVFSSPLATTRPRNPPTVVASAVRDSSDQKFTSTLPPTAITSPSHSAQTNKPPSEISLMIQSNDQGMAISDLPPKREKKTSRFMAERKH